MNKPKVLWLLSEFVIFAIYTIVFFAITDSWIWGVLSAAFLVVLHNLVSKALDKVEIEGQ